MIPEIHLRLRARFDILELVGFYANGDEAIGERFLDAVESTYLSCGERLPPVRLVSI